MKWECSNPKDSCCMRLPIVREKLARAEAEARALRDGYDALDRNWTTIHEAAMGPIRAALGLPDGTVPELLAAIHAAQAEARALRQKMLAADVIIKDMSDLWAKDQADVPRATRTLRWRSARSENKLFGIKDRPPGSLVRHRGLVAFESARTPRPTPAGSRGGWRNWRRPCGSTGGLSSTRRRRRPPRRPISGCHHRASLGRGAEGGEMDDWERRRMMQRAHAAVRMACLTGVLEEPARCETCGKEVRLNAHHDDYRRPLDVRWLCPGCHKRHHMSLKPRRFRGRDATQHELPVLGGEGRECMSWLKLESRYPRHPKLMGCSVMACWMDVCGMAYCAEYLTDGFVSDAAIRVLDSRLRSSRRHADELVNCGRWERVDGGYRIHDYLHYNPSAAEALADEQRSRRIRQNWR